MNDVHPEPFYGYRRKNGPLDGETPGKGQAANTSNALHSCAIDAFPGRFPRASVTHTRPERQTHKPWLIRRFIQKGVNDPHRASPMNAPNSSPHHLPSDIPDGPADGNGGVLRKSRVFLLDDHPLFRFGLKRLLEGQPDLTVCGEARNAIEGLDEALKLRPDLIIA
jgi:hypothetical protein